MKTAFTPFSLLAFLPLAAPAQKRFNILYIMTDDHTSQMMSCYDKTHVQTPNLDRIALLEMACALSIVLLPTHSLDQAAPA